MDEILQKVVKWAESQEAIRGLVLTSSRAGASQTDEFSDYDVMVLTDQAEQYLASDKWIESIKPVWVYQKEQFTHGPDVISTRLVIFEGGAKVDFSFWKLDILKKFVKNGFSGTDDLNRGYQVLMDKDGLTRTCRRQQSSFSRYPNRQKMNFLRPFTISGSRWPVLLSILREKISSSPKKLITASSKTYCCE